MRNDERERKRGREEIKSIPVRQESLRRASMRKLNTYTNRHTDRKRQTHRQKETDTQTERDQTKKEREKERERASVR